PAFPTREDHLLGIVRIIPELGGVPDLEGVAFGGDNPDSVIAARDRKMDATFDVLTWLLPDLCHYSLVLDKEILRAQGRDQHITPRGKNSPPHEEEQAREGALASATNFVSGGCRDGESGRPRLSGFTHQESLTTLRPRSTAGATRAGPCRESLPAAPVRCR